MSRLSPQNYDSWRCSPPEDQAGYHEEERPLSQAERLMSAANAAAAYLRGNEFTSITFGKLPEDVVREVAERARCPFVVHPYEPGESMRRDFGYGDKPRVIYSFDYRAHGVCIHGQGSRAATEAEIAEAAK